MLQQTTTTRQVDIKCFKYSRQVQAELTTVLNRTSITANLFPVFLYIFSFIYLFLLFRSTDYLLEIFSIQSSHVSRSVSLLLAYLLSISGEFPKFIFQIFDYALSCQPSFLLLLRQFIIVSSIFLLTFSFSYLTLVL